MNKDRRLGRGLAALLGTPAETSDGTTPDATLETRADITPASVSDVPSGSGSAGSGAGIIHLDVTRIDDNPFQPRRDFGDTEIASLAESLKRHEMLQPVLVRQAGERYQLISGERRLRAAIRAGWSTIPAQVRAADDRLAAELAIVENLQRKDLNPIEKALSFKRYIDQHQCKQEELAKRLKIDRSTVANLMRLLELPDTVVEHVRADRISASHARALLPLGDEPLQVEFANRIIDDGWSVRATEREVSERIQDEDREPLRVAGVIGPGASKPAAKPARKTNQHVAALEQQLRTALGTRVDIRQNGKGRGRIVIHFTSHDEFERLQELLASADATLQRDVG